MNTPMFEQPKDEITTMFTPDGILQVVIGQTLGHVQKKQWKIGASRINGIRWLGLAVDAPYAKDQTVFEVAIDETYSQHTHDVQASVRAYTERFLATLAPEPTQQTLF